MRALLFGAPPSEDEVRPTPEDEFEAKLIETPFGLHEIDEARLVPARLGHHQAHPLGHLRLRRQAGTR